MFLAQSKSECLWFDLKFELVNQQAAIFWDKAIFFANKMSSDHNPNTDCQAQKKKYEEVLHQIVHMRRTYPAACSSYLSSALRKDADMMMKAEVIPIEESKDMYIPQYLDSAKLEKLNLITKLEPLTSKGKDFDQQIADIRSALNQIRAARHKNVQE